MTAQELIHELEKVAWNREALVWVQLEEGIDAIGRVEIENGVATLIPTSQDSA